ncbi:MAG TPA: PPA1309 family protein [Aeromicrobium sp.]|nr:PPA1309 family protein [Aeromicrobium sp.]
MPDSPLRRAALEVEAHVGEQGWDQPARLFALVSTEALLEQQPQLAGQLSGEGYTAIEQEGAVEQRELEQLLTEITWPDAVEGCAVVVERVMLPPEAEESLPDDPYDAVRAAASHPDRTEVRLVAAVLRDGDAHSAVRAREPETAELLEGPDLVPGLIAQLRRTFDPS